MAEDWNNDAAKQLFKVANDLARSCAEATTYADVISPQSILARGQLKNVCHRIMLESPVNYGLKAEELLWRKVVYDVIQAMKRMQKRGQHDSGVSEASLATTLKLHLMSSVGFYQNLLVCFQLRYGLDLRNFIDTPVLNEVILYRKSHSHSLMVVDKETRDAVMELCYRTLVCLGNLARYQCSYLDDWTKALPTRFYYQALLLKPDTGLPHNQLALLAGARTVESAYHWLLCLCSADPFAPAKKNLMECLAKISVRSLQKNGLLKNSAKNLSLKLVCNQLMVMVHQFLQLSEARRPLSQNTLQRLFALSEDTLSNFALYLQHCSDPVATNGSSATCSSKSMPSDVLFKLIVVCQAVVFLMEKQLSLNQANANHLVVMATAVTLALYARVLRYISDKIRMKLGLNQTVKSSSSPAKHNNNVKKPGVLKLPRKSSAKVDQQLLWSEFESGDEDGGEDKKGGFFGKIREEDLEELGGDADEELEAPVANSAGSSSLSQEDDCPRNVGGNKPSSEGSSAEEELEENGEDEDDSDSEAVGEYASSTEDTSPTPPPTTTPIEVILSENGASYLSCVKIIIDWLVSNPRVMTALAATASAEKAPGSGFGPHQSLWESIADLVAVLPSPSSVMKSGEIQDAVFNHVENWATLPQWSQRFPLPEDRAIGKFGGLAKAQGGIDLKPNSWNSSTPLKCRETALLRLAVIFRFARTNAADWLEFDERTATYSLRRTQQVRQQQPLQATNSTSSSGSDLGTSNVGTTSFVPNSTDIAAKVAAAITQPMGFQPQIIAPPAPRPQVVPPPVVPSLSATLLDFVDDEEMSSGIHGSGRMHDAFGMGSTASSSASAVAAANAAAKELQMKQMAKLWLESEVNRLEIATNPMNPPVRPTIPRPVSNSGSMSSSAISPPVQQQPSGMALPVYVILVSDTLLSPTHVVAVRRLVESDRFIVVIPQAVIAALDYEKTTNQAAREASRFFEFEVRRGSQNLRLYQHPVVQARFPPSFRSIPGALSVARQILNENAHNAAAAHLPACLIAIVSSSRLDQFPPEVGSFVNSELSKFNCKPGVVAFRTLDALLAGIGVAM